MRHVVRSVITGLAVTAAFAGAAGAQAKLGYVNTQTVMSQAPTRAAAESEFNRRMAPLNAEMQKMDSTWKSMLASFARDSASPTAQRETRAAEMQRQQQQFQTRMQAIEDTAAALRQRLMQPIVQQMERALEEVRREGGYSMLFDVGQGAMIVAADTTLDVTPRVIAKMKAAGPAAAAPTAPARPAQGPVAAPAGVGTRPPATRR
jgi:outer membrane protein